MARSREDGVMLAIQLTEEKDRARQVAQELEAVRERESAALAASVSVCNVHSPPPFPAPPPPLLSLLLHLAFAV